MEKTRSKIIIVDDNMANLMLGKNMLKLFYEIYPALSASKLFEILENLTPDLILLDIEMPEMNGYETIKKLKEDPRYKDIPVIFLTAKNDENSELDGFDLGAVDYITKPFSAPLLLKRIANQLLIVQQKKALIASRDMIMNYANTLESKVHNTAEQVTNLQNTILSTLADFVEFRDELTGGHILRTQLYIKTLVNEILREGLYYEEIRDWNMDYFLASTPLHDIGKLTIPDNILNKPDKLTTEEFELMKTHVTAGMDVIEKIMNNTSEHTFLQHAFYIAGAHHEKWNGLGYPMGLKGNDIPLEGRLMAIADVYDALISRRSYKEPFSCEKSKKLLEEDSGIHFDPKLINVFENVHGEFERIAREISQ